MKSSVLTGLVFGLTSLAVAADGKPIEIESVQLTLLEQVEVPAREAGVLQRVSVREGSLVKVGDVLGRIDDTEAALARRHATIAAEIAAARAENGIGVAVAEKSRELASADVARAETARKTFRKAVTDADLQRLKLAFELAELEVDRAEHERRLERMTAKMKQTEVEVATRAVARRAITSPISGKVVQLHRQGGEWVKPGDAVFRVLRLDRLRGEAFLDATVATPSIEGRSVTVTWSIGERTRTTSGVVTFVDPEINPVDRRVRVWFDVDNTSGELRPGQRVSARIHPAEASAADSEP